MTDYGKEGKNNMNQNAMLRVIDGGRPASENGKVPNVPPRRPRNAESRPREYLTPDEVELLIKAARGRGRWGARDAALILLGYRHGLRVSELVNLRWDAVDLENRQLHVTRRKNGKPSVQPLRDIEIRELRKLRKGAERSPFVFRSERGGALSTRSARYLIAEAGAAAKLAFPVHPHMLRHACGYKLANDGVDTRTVQDYLGHRNINHTTVYTALNSERFSELWEE